MAPSSLAISPRGSTERGSALIATLIVVGILAFVAGTVLLTAMPAYRTSYHAAAWLEARLAADAGVDFGVSAIQASLPDTNAYTWPGWTKANGTTPWEVGDDGIRMIVPPANLLANRGDGSVMPTILKVEIDVYTRDDNILKNPWYRIRSTGSAEIESSQVGIDKRDMFLRRLTLTRKRVTRTVEVICRPVYLFEYALKTRGAMTLGGGTDWVIDSYDSRYSSVTTGPYGHRGSSGGSGPEGSYKGMYDIAKAGAFANIASDLERSATSPYGMLIDAAGAMVRGEVQTNGGDDPSTLTFENVAQSGLIDQTRISSDFDETLLPPKSPLPLSTAQDPGTVRPIVTDWSTLPSAETYRNYFNPPENALPISVPTKPAVGMTAANPVRILLQPNGNHSQGSFAITAPTDGLPHFVEIYIDADFVPGSTGVVIPPDVHAKVFVNGSIDIGNRDINYSSSSSRLPANLQIYGVKPATPTSSPTIASAGNGHLVGVFYGPQYASGLNGNTEVVGSIVVDSYGIQGGGGNGGDSVGAGFHYDEALGTAGPIQAYRVLSYFEDIRKDLE